MKIVAAIAAVLVLAGCGGSGNANAPAPSGTQSSASSATLAACTGYARVQPTVSDWLQNPEKHFQGISTFVIADIFNARAQSLRDAMVTADGDLAAQRDAAVAGLQSIAATAKAWRSGTLDIGADIQAATVASQGIRATCTIADPTTTYLAFDGS